MTKYCCMKNWQTLSILMICALSLVCIYVTQRMGLTSTSTFKKHLVVKEIVPFTDVLVATKGAAKSPFSNPFTDEEINRLENGFTDQVHPRLLEWIRTHWIHPPSGRRLNLSHPEKLHHSQYGQSNMIDKILQHKRNGFFVECGAYDGERLSNTLFLERFRNWTGLLIEAEKTLFQKLQTKNRRTFSINACLNGKNTSGSVKLGIDLNPGKYAINALADEKLRTIKYKDSEYVPVQCFTLYSMMKALNRTKIDFFSLDVEGAELGILKTIPFSHLDIDLLLIEYAMYKGTKAESKKRFVEIDSFIQTKGYELIQKTFIDLWYRKKRIN